jgi:transcriptional regulator with XRE-family HTH domain
LADLIRYFRVHVGDTQEEFARRLGVSVGSVAHYETGSRPNKRVLKRMSEIAHQHKEPALARSFLGMVHPQGDREAETVALVRSLYIYTLNAPKTQAALTRFLDDSIKRALREHGYPKNKLPEPVKLLLGLSQDTDK